MQWKKGTVEGSASFEVSRAIEAALGRRRKGQGVKRKTQDVVKDESMAFPCAGDKWPWKL